MNRATQSCRVREFHSEIMRFVQIIRERSACEFSIGQREDTRYLRSWPIIVSLRTDGTGTCFGAALHNGSPGGLAFLSDRKLEPACLLGLQLFWFARDPLWVPGVVRHCTQVTHGRLTGCEFVLAGAEQDANRQLAGLAI